jgi:hypothetical protein
MYFADIQAEWSIFRSAQKAFALQFVVDKAFTIASTVISVRRYFS